MVMTKYKSKNEKGKLRFAASWTFNFLDLLIHYSLQRAQPLSLPSSNDGRNMCYSI